MSRPFAGSGGSSSCGGKPIVWKCKVCVKDHCGKNYGGKVFCYRCKKEGNYASSSPSNVYSTQHRMRLI